MNLRLVPILITAIIGLALPAVTAAGQPPIPWTNVADGERRALDELLQTSDWPLRVMGLLRLERYQGEAAHRRVLELVGDPAWQVRCFALRQAQRMNVAVDPALLEKETEPRVVRAALRTGVSLPDEVVDRGTKRLWRMRDADGLMLGLEIAAASSSDALREEASRRILRLIQNLDDPVAARIGDRLAFILHADPKPDGADGWRRWLAERRGRIKLHATPPRRFAALQQEDSNLVAGLDPARFTRLIEYLDGLRQRDLQVAIVMDSTTSMLPMINEARAGVDRIILFLRDVSRSMQLGFVAYRDHDNPPVWEGVPFTADVDRVREFLFGLEITGGVTYPEAVLDGLTACRDLDWNRRAERMIIVVGDAPPHEEDLYKVAGVLKECRDGGVVVHTAHVPMERPAGFEQRLAPDQVAVDRQWVASYNAATARTFAEMATMAGGRAVTLDRAEQLVPAIMRFTIEESWWAVFDQFYEAYLELCR